MGNKQNVKSALGMPRLYGIGVILLCRAVGAEQLNPMHTLRRMQDNIDSYFQPPNGSNTQKQPPQTTEPMTFKERLKARKQFKVLKWHFAQSEMPYRLSDFSVTEALAPNDNGDLTVLHYIIGGCEDESRSSVLSKEQPGRVGGIFPTCWDVGDHTYTYDPELDLFAKRRDALRRRYRHAAYLVNGNIWVLGGRDAQDQIVNEVDMYVPQQDKWHYVGDLPPHLLTSDMAVFSKGDYLYVAGGYSQEYIALSNTFRLDTVRSYSLYERNPDNKKQLVTELLGNLNEPRGSIMSVQYGRYAYVAGGYSNVNSFCSPLYTVERYDLDSNKWMYVGNLKDNEARSSAALIKYDGKFLVIGGDTRTDTDECDAGLTQEHNARGGIVSVAVDTVETFDPLDGLDAKWIVLRSDTTEGRMRYGAKSWPSTGAIYVFGGMTDGPEGCNCYFSSNRILVYQPEMVKNRRFGVVTAAIVTFLFMSLLLAICICIQRRKHKYKTLYAADHEKKKIVQEVDDDLSDDGSEPGIVVTKSRDADDNSTKGDSVDDIVADDDQFFYDKYLHHLDNENANKR